MQIKPSEMEALERVERAIQKSKQPRYGRRPDDGAFFNSIMRWVDYAKETEPSYQADTRKRDRWLSSFWKTEPHLAGVLSSVNSIDANRGWHLTGGRNQVARFVNVFRNADNGKGWRRYLSQQSTSYYTCDIGAITEIGRDGISGPMRALYHVDPTLCHMTGDEDRPLKYDKNKRPWRDDDFFRLVSMENIEESMKGAGLCAVSRVLDMSKIMLAIYNHELESLGARAPRGLLLLQNIGQNQWIEAMKTRDAQLDSDMRKYYQAVAVIAQEGVDSIDAKLVALSQLPEGFDIEVFTNLLLYAYALCIGYDPVEFWPVQQGQMGRGRETDIQHRKGTGKGGLNFMLAYQDQMLSELPDSLAFEFEQRDQEGVLLDAEVAQAWANVVATLYGGGKSTAPGPGAGDGKAPPTEPPDSKVKPNQGQAKPVEPILTREEARQLLVNKGVIPATWTEMEEDVSATDAKNLEERHRRDLILSDERVLQAVYQFPREPIVRYSYNGITGKGKTEILFRNKEDALKRTRYTILKPEPAALIPDFSAPDGGVEMEEVVDAEWTERLVDEPVEEPDRLLPVLGAFNMYRGDTRPLAVNVKTRSGESFNLENGQIAYFAMDESGKTVLMKDTGNGIVVSGSLVTVYFDPEDTRRMRGVYTHRIKMVDDIGQPFTVFSGKLVVLGETDG